MSTRIANGKTIPGENVVAADAISKLAGVPLTTTVKVLIALNMLALTTNVSLVELISLASLPTAPADDQRFQATEEFNERLVHRMQKSDMRLFADELRIHRRFATA